MKKMIFSLLAIAATMNVMATNFSAKATLTLTTSDASCEIVIAETNDNPASLCAPMNFTGRDIAIYVKSGDKKYELFATDKLEDIELGLMTNAKTSYTLTATEVEGNPISIKLLDGTTFVASEGATTTFTAQASQQEIKGMMVNPHAVPAEFKLCHQFNKIIIDNNEAAGMKVSLDGDSIGFAPAKTFAAEISLDAVAAGQHKLVVGDKPEVIINVKPVPVAE